jgi:hypothetical protein
MHPHDRMALAIGYYKRPDGVWLNSWGASRSGPPAETSWDTWKGVIQQHFEPSFNNRIHRRTDRFLAEYRDDMTPEELCALVLRVMETDA